MDSISRTWRTFYHEILAISPMWWGIFVVVVLISLVGWISMRAR